MNSWVLTTDFLYFRQSFRKRAIALEIVLRHAAQAVIKRPIRLHRLDVVPLCRIFLGDSGIQVEDGGLPHQIQPKRHLVTSSGGFIGPCSHFHLTGLQIELAHHFRTFSSKSFMPCSACVLTKSMFDFATRTFPRPRPQSRIGITNERLTYCWSSGSRQESFNLSAVCDKPNCKYKSAFSPRFARACANWLLLSSFSLRYISGSGLCRYASSSARPNGTSKRGT